MSQLHRRLDHDFAIWSRQLNYSLFGNERGAHTQSRRVSWSNEPYDYRQSRRHENAFVKYNQASRPKWNGRAYDQREIDLWQLRMIETDAFGAADYADEPINGGIGHL